MALDEMRWVRGAHYTCAQNRCQLAQAAALLEQAGRVAEEANQKMIDSRWTLSLWCEVGGHSFSSRDTGRRLRTETIAHEDGSEDEVTLTCCGAHAGPQVRRIGNSYQQALNGPAEDATP